MIPASFDYVRAGTVDEASELLQSTDDARLIAGGQSLIPLLKERRLRPRVLVDIDRLPELDFVRHSDNGFEIGALTRLHALSRHRTVRAECPALAAAAGDIADPQVRHRGTIGGSLVHADPRYDLPAIMLALDAEFRVHGAAQRTIRADEFFTGPGRTALAPGEVLTSVRIAAPADGGRLAYQKFRRRRFDTAVVGVAVVARIAEQTITDARIALASMSPTPIRAVAAERALVGQPVTAAVVAAAVRQAAVEAAPADDVHASAEYRRDIVGHLLECALGELTGQPVNR